MTLSTRGLVDKGSTSPLIRLITISTNPPARMPRRGWIISRMSGHSSRKRSEWLRLGFSIFSATIISVYSGTYESTVRRYVGLRVSDVETGLLSSEIGCERLSEALRSAAELRRDQLHVPPVAESVDAGKLGFSYARRIRIRVQSAHANHAPVAIEGIGIYGIVLPGDRSPASHAPPGAGSVSIAAELQSRSDAAGVV